MAGTAFSEQTTLGDKVAVAVFFLLPPLTAYANKGTVILLVLLGLANLWDVVRAGRKLPSLFWPRPLIGALVGLLVWAAFSALWAETPGLALPRSLEMAGLVVAGAAALVMLPSWGATERRRVGLALTAGLLLLFVAVALDVTQNGMIDGALRRLTGRAPNPTIGASRFKIAVTVAGIMLPPLLLWHWWNRRWWALVILPAGLIGCGIVAHSNTGMLAAVVSGAVLLMALAVPRAVAAVIALLVAGSFLTAPLVIRHLPPPKELAEAIPFMPNSMMHRLAIWRFTADHVVERPLAGWGFDASREIPGGDRDIPAPVRNFGQVTEVGFQAMPLHPHNLMLQIWLELGFVGIAGFVVLSLSIIAAALRPPSLTAPALGMTVGALVVGAASFGAWQAWWVSAQWLFAVLCLILSTTKGNDTANL